MEYKRVRRHQIGKLNGRGGQLMPRLFVTHAVFTDALTVCGIKVRTAYHGWVPAPANDYVDCQRCRRTLDREEVAK